MTNEYDKITSSHYAAYRPPFHTIILEKCLAKKQKFHTGLDIGCGTGQSSIALTDYCDNVFGIDPSQEMLENALKHPKVLYSIYEAEKLKFENRSFDIITFAGSLYYAKSQKVVDEVVRVSKMGAKIILYDFEILLNDILATLHFEPWQSNTYNHQEDFSGLQCENLEFVFKKKEKVYLAIKAEQLSHLILSVKEHYLFFRELFMEIDVHKALTTKLKKAHSSEKFQIQATIFYSQYHVV